MPAGTGDEGDAFRAVRMHERTQPFRHFVIGLVPRDARPLSAAPWADAAQGMQKPVRVIHLLDDAHALHAGAAAVQRPVRIGADVGDDPVLHGKEVHTPPVTAAACALVFRHGMHLHRI